MCPAGRPAIRDRWPIGSTRPGVDRKASVEIRRGGAEDVCILIRWPKPSPTSPTNASAVSRVSATASLLKEGSRRTLTNRSPYRRDAAGSQWLETECFPSVTALQAATAKQE